MRLQQLLIVVSCILSADLILLCCSKVSLLELFITAYHQISEDCHALGDRLFLELGVLRIIIQQFAEGDLEIYGLVVRA